MGGGREGVGEALLRLRSAEDGDLTSKSGAEGREGGKVGRGASPAVPINAVFEQRVEGYRMDGRIDEGAEGLVL